MSKKMKVLKKKYQEKGLWLDEAPIPELGPNDVLVKIKKTAICGTDLHIYNWDPWSQKNIKVPMVIGHEFSGVIEDVGHAVIGYKKHDRVSGEGHLTCGYCRNCRAGKRHLCHNTKGVGIHRQGCFAEYLAIPASNVFKLHEQIDDDIASIFDPYGNALHATTSFDLVGEDVVITGAGPIGCMSCAIARFAGARNVVITDVNDYRLGLAAEMGATRTVNVKRENLLHIMDQMGMTEGFDVGLEMSGCKDALAAMVEVMNNGGRVALLGIYPKEIEVDINGIVLKGLFLKGIYGREMFETWYKMAAMIRSGLDISKIITHRFKVDNYQDGFDIMNQGKAGKVILDWT